MGKRAAVPARATVLTRDELRDLSERLLLAGLREQELAEQCRRAESAARQQFEDEHRLRTLVERLSAEREAMLAQLAEGIILADAGGRVTFLNGAARALLEVTDLPIAGEDASATDHLFATAGDPCLAEQSALAQAARQGESAPLPRRRLRHRDGTDVVIEGSAVPVFATEGTRLGAVLALRDVTAEADLERRKEDFLTAVAHDLQSPLTVISGFSQLLRRRALREGRADNAPWLADQGQIDGAAAQMGAMVEGLLDLGRLQLGAYPGLQRATADLVPLARRVVEDYRRRTTAHTLRLETAEETVVGRWNADRLVRAIANLVGNAIKYSPNGGDVIVRLWREANAHGLWVLLSVEDRGIGIPTADRAGLFERFRRGSNVVGRIAGTGIGLMSVQQIAEEHGGSVAVESTEGHGSTFTLRLRLPAPADVASAAR